MPGSQKIQSRRKLDDATKYFSGKLRIRGDTTLELYLCRKLPLHDIATVLSYKDPDKYYFWINTPIFE